MASSVTEKMLLYLPSWMKMRKDPNSIGAQFLDCVGVQLEDIENYLDELLNDQFIGTAATSQPDIIYKYPFGALISSEVEITNVEGVLEGITYVVEIQDGLRPFYLTADDSDNCVFDFDKKLLYTRRQYDFINIEGTGPYVGQIHHVWNSFDEFGLLLDCPRLFGEKNSSYKTRLLDVFKKPGSSTKTGLANYISRELQITETDVKLNTMADPAFINTLLNEDGTANSAFKNYVKIMQEKVPILWGSARWDEAYWDLIQQDLMGLDYLPHIWNIDISGWDDDSFQSGIGEGDDLKIDAPKLIDDTQKFDYYVGLQGIKETPVEIAPEISLKYSLQAKGKIPTSILDDEKYYYTIIASEDIRVSFGILAYKIYNKNTTSNFSVGEIATLTNTEVIAGNLITNPSSSDGTQYPYIKMTVTMDTTNYNNTPQVDSITINHNSGSIVFDTQANFEEATHPVPNTWETTVDGKLQLATLNLDKNIDWDDAQAKRTQVYKDANGYLALQLPK